MKQIVFPLLALLVLSCAQREFRVEGRFSAPEGTQVYLINQGPSDTLASTVVSEGLFTFEGQVQEPFYAYIGTGRQRIHTILEAGTVKVDLDERTSEGTPLIDAYNTFHKRFYAYSRDQREEKTDLADSVVRANPDNLVGALALEDLAHANPEHFLSLYEQVSERIQGFYLVESAYQAALVQQRTAPGQPFTDYTVKGGHPDGSDVKLSDYVGRGQYVLLDHWASWCGPCKADIPYIRKTWEAYHGDRFQVVSIAVSDKREDTLSALEKLDMPWPQILDGGRIAKELYGVSAIPHLILFGPDGTILERGLRGDMIYQTVGKYLGN